MGKKNKDIEILMVDEPEEMEYNYGYKTSKEKRRFIDRIKRACRTSMEYKDYIAFLRDNIGMDACAFFNNINKETNRRIRIEVHHAPLTLEDIVRTVINKYEGEGIPLNDLMIADEVMHCHYGNMVGLIPLSKTMHEVIHNSDKLVIPAYLIYGDYKKFLEEYGEYADDCIEKVEEMIEITKELKRESYDFLEKKYTYLQVDGFTIPSKIDMPEKEKKEMLESMSVDEQLEGFCA